MNLFSHLIPSALAALVTPVSTIAYAQFDVYNNQGNPTSDAIGFLGNPTVWDDLSLTQGGLLSELSFIAEPPFGSGSYASGVIELRRFDEAFNRPQGELLASLPFSGNFPVDPLDNFGRRRVIDLKDLESQGIALSASGRIGAGIRFDTPGWIFSDFGVPEVGASPGGALVRLLA